MHKYAALTALAIALNITAAAAQTVPTCETFLTRLRNAGRELSLPSLPNPRFEHQRDVANSVEQVIYDWPNDTSQIGVLSCIGQFIFYKMQADTAARRLRNLHLISAAIFAYTGRPPESSALQLLLTQQPRRPNDINEARLALPGGYWVRLGYDNFAISVCRGAASACGAV
jgi:hypothetical protein